MVAAGVPILENRPDCIHLGAAGHVLGTGHTLRDEFTAYVPSRPHLEWQIRRRVQAIDNVAIQRRSVAEPRFDRIRGRVTGVLLDASDPEPADPEFVAADFVVDAAGRGTRLPVWLTQWGYARPTEQTVDIGINYATHYFRIPEGLIQEKVVVAGAAHDQSLGLGMLCYEDGTWVLTTFGVADAKPPTTFAEMLLLADELLPSHFTDALAQAEPVGEPAFHAFPVSRWRRYDKLDSFPAGILPFGDAVASFNPTFGQGMTMTSLQAGHLRRALRSGTEDVVAELNRATAKTTYPVWIMNAIGDTTFHHAAHRTGPLVVAAVRCAVRPIPRRRRNRTRSGRMVFAPVLAARQPLYGPAAADHRPHHRAQPAAVAARAPRTAARHATKPSQTYGRPEQLGGLPRDQPDGAVVGGHPGRHAALQRQ